MDRIETTGRRLGERGAETRAGVAGLGDRAHPGSPDGSRGVYLATKSIPITLVAVMAAIVMVALVIHSR